MISKLTIPKPVFKGRFNTVDFSILYHEKLENALNVYLKEIQFLSGDTEISCAESELREVGQV